MKALRIFTLAWPATLTVLFLYVAFARLGFPHELEWMTGGVLDHIERVRAGQPLYAAPSADWIPFLYPPLHYWICALLWPLFPGFLGCRLISLAATGVQALCVWRLARRLDATRFWAAIGVGLFFAAFLYTGCWYDLERCDSLFVAMMTVATVLLVETRGMAGTVLAGLVVGLGFFAKQPAVLFWAGGTAALAIGRQWKRALAFAAPSAVVMAVGTLWLSARSGGWFTYYVLKMPSTHGIEGELVAHFLTLDIARGFLLVLGTAALLAMAAPGLRERRLAQPEMFACMLAAAFWASASSRMHLGGYANVLMFWATFACVAVARVGTRAEAALAKTPFVRLGTAGLYGAVMLQCGQWAYDPRPFVPPPEQARYATDLARTVAQWEASGKEVLVMGRGHTSAHRHFHTAALVDVLRTEHRVPADLADAFRTQRFAAVVLDSLEDLYLSQTHDPDMPFFRLVAAHYYVADRLDDRAPAPVVGYPHIPSFVLRPRRQGLSETDKEALLRHQAMEVRLAELRGRARQVGAASWRDDAQIEELAAALADGRGDARAVFGP